MGITLYPCAGNGYGFGYVMKVAGIGIQRCYPRIVYPLPSLLVEFIHVVVWASVLSRVCRCVRVIFLLWHLFPFFLLFNIMMCTFRACSRKHRTTELRALEWV
jgi:hypothetical protein